MRNLLAIILIAGSLTTCCQEANALDNNAQLSFLLTHGDYHVTQEYLSYWSGNPTPDNRHAGVDFATPTGTVIYAPVSGAVIKVGGSLGYCTLYNSTLDVSIIFLHLSTINYSVGDTVNVGEIIGAAGSAGTGGSHLHIEVRPGRRTHAVGPTSGSSTAALTIDPLAAFSNSSGNGLTLYETVHLSGSGDYEIFYTEYYHPGEITAIVKNSGTLDADLYYYSWSANSWYPLSAYDGNEFWTISMGSGQPNSTYPLYIAVVAWSGSGTAEVMWHSSSSAE
ncbi:putative peptidase [Rubripirellula tenax]|uniref:Putative peptidase n=1 Tax=Rubripirellula tenax TaxID=2528015 RepID=A0A5C6F2M4_9BACT|nr:M23 family metallopeptidase [Rubripirellula tenax]TWU54790.1 putative peptidase [Rubripirellula tenax]